MSRPPSGCDGASGDIGAGRSDVGVRGGSGGTAGSNISAVDTRLGSRAGGTSSDGAATSSPLLLALAIGDTVTWGAGAATTRGSESELGRGSADEVRPAPSSSSPTRARFRV